MPPPTVHPVDEPLALSVMIPVYNCADLLADLLPEVVAQLEGRGDVEIVVVDDASSDDPAAVVERLGAGIVDYRRNGGGLGAIGNFNECLRLSRGRLVHLLHGDDGVKPGFYAKMAAALDERPNVAAAVCRTEYIDADGAPLSTTRSERSGSGPWDGALDVLAVSNRVRPAAIIVRRSTYEAIGGFDPDLPHAADWDMWARIAASGTLYWVDEVLAKYRVHGASDTAQRVRSGVNMTERLEAIAMIAGRLPPERRRRAVRRAAGYSSLFALRTALSAARRSDWSATKAQIVAAGRCASVAVVPGRLAGSHTPGPSDTRRPGGAD